MGSINILLRKVTDLPRDTEEMFLIIKESAVYDSVENDLKISMN